MASVDSRDFSFHALRRCQQRGISQQIVNTILVHADLRVWVGNGCQSLLVSRRRLAELVPDELEPGEAGRLGGVCVVQDVATGEVVTVLRLAGRSGRRYRKQHRCRRHQRPSTENRRRSRQQRVHI